MRSARLLAVCSVLGLALVGCHHKSSTSECATYLSCLQTLDPGAYPAAEAEYGPSGACDTNSSTRKVCEQSCSDAIAQLGSSCTASSGGKDGGSTPVVANTLPLIVDGNDQSFNVPYITIKVCAPGSTTNCATLDHVLVDTGSIGLRIPSDTLATFPGLLAALPSQTVGGLDIAECYVYASGYFFGSVKLVDLTMAGETSANMPVQIGGDLTAPSSCSSLSQGGMEIDSGAALHANAIIGVSPLKLDCGSKCADVTTQTNPVYYTCVGTACTPAAVPEAQQVPQPISTFASDNNGYIMQLPSVDDTMGAASPMGTMTFGINTQADNQLGSQTVYQANSASGLPVVEGAIGTSTFPDVVFDSGTPLYVVSLPDVTACTGEFQGLYCPASLQSLSMTVTASTGATGTTTVKIADASAVLGSAPQTTTAFDDLAENGASSGLPSELFIVGLTHFYGKSMYFGMDGDTVGTHTGPFYAF